MPEKSRSIYFQPLANRRLRSLSTKGVCFVHIILVYYPVNTASAENFQQLFGSTVALLGIGSLVSSISRPTLRHSSEAHRKNCDSIFFEWIIDNSMSRASASWPL